MSREERKSMITRDAPDLSLSHQCRLLSFSRSSFYYTPKGESPGSLALMRRIGAWIDFYKTERSHSTLAGRTPAEALRSRAQQQQSYVINTVLAA